MRAFVGEFSSDFVGKSSARFSTKCAWAEYARRRWPQNGVKQAMAEWGLTEGEAKGLFATQISQPTIDKIIDHPRGGFGLALRILEIRTQTGLRSWLTSEQERLAHEAARAAADADALAEMASRLPAGNAVGRAGLGGVRPRKPRVVGEGRSFVGHQRDRSPERLTWE